MLRENVEFVMTASQAEAVCALPPARDGRCGAERRRDDDARWRRRLRRSRRSPKPQGPRSCRGEARRGERGGQRARLICRGRAHGPSSASCAEPSGGNVFFADADAAVRVSCGEPGVDASFGVSRGEPGFGADFVVGVRERRRFHREPPKRHREGARKERDTPWPRPHAGPACGVCQRQPVDAV